MGNEHIKKPRVSVKGLTERLAQSKEKMRTIMQGKKPVDSRESKRRAVGSWVGRLQYVQHKYPGNPIRQFDAMMEEGGLTAVIGRQRVVSEKSMTDLKDILARAVGELKQCGMPIRNAGEIGKKHVIALIKHWESNGNAWKTIATKISVLRRYTELINKHGAVPVREQLYRWLDENGINAHHNRRSRIAETSKAWSARGVDPAQVIAKIAETEPLFAILLELQLAFGLRKDESISLEPRASDEGSKMVITKGTKGGRPRTVDFDEDPEIGEWQRDLVERAKVFAMEHPQRRMSSAGLTTKQMTNWMNNMALKFGVTEKDMGVTMHGLRHEYVSRIFTAKTGLPPQSEGTVPAVVYEQHAEAVKQARLYVSEQVGHWREDITSSYFGSTPRLKKLSRQRMGDWIRRFEENSEVMRHIAESDVDRMWLVGNAGMGLVMLPSSQLEILVQVRALDEAATQQVERLQTRLETAFGRKVMVSVALRNVSPASALEILLPIRAKESELAKKEPCEIA